MELALIGEEIATLEEAFAVDARVLVEITTGKIQDLPQIPTR